MYSIKYTKNLFLNGLSFIYLFAFLSFYHQMPGLFGSKGILPVHSLIKFNQKGSYGIEEALNTLPSFVWFAPQLGLNFDLMLDLIALIGALISVLTILFPSAKNCINFTILYLLYYSIYQIGQVFFQFQWDILLLETGFLAIFVSQFFFSSKIQSSNRDLVTFWLVKWLLFRFMFSSGAVKLTSKCPLWWSLTALNYHFESQCIPTSLAWFAHQIPKWFLKLGVVATFLIEIPVPFLFFAPTDSLRKFSFWSQVLLQLLIILTGNFNFFNLLTLVLCISLLDDSQLPSFFTQNERYLKKSSNTWSTLFNTFVYAFLIYWTIRLFNLKLDMNGKILSTITFDEKAFRNFLNVAVPLSIVIASISLAFRILQSYYRDLFSNTSFVKKLFSLFSTTFYSLIAFWLFSISLISYTHELDLETHKSIWPVLHKWKQNTRPLVVTESYGLFRVMTGLEGRPELIIEGSDSLESGWKEYHFLYKPGNLTKTPSFLIPHQPRLDWQMWFAALGNYQRNPWLLSFIYRLLNREESVLNLIDKSNLLFKNAPQNIRVKLYTYKYTKIGDSKQPQKWWNREMKGTYLPPVNKETLLKYLQTVNIDVNEDRTLKVYKSYLVQLLRYVRLLSNQVSPHVFIYSITGIILTIVMTTKS